MDDLFRRAAQAGDGDALHFRPLDRVAVVGLGAGVGVVEVHHRAEGHCGGRAEFLWRAVEDGGEGREGAVELEGFGEAEGGFDGVVVQVAD